MTHISSTTNPVATSALAALILAIAPGRRGAVLQSVVSFRPHHTLEQSFAVGPLRAAFADYWEAQCGEPVPIEKLRSVLDPPVLIKTVLEFSKLMLVRDIEETNQALAELVRHLQHRLGEVGRPPSSVCSIRHKICSAESATQKRMEEHGIG